MTTLLRIGEVARRAGLSPELLRAWERRYGVLRPERTAGGFRLYSEEDVRRVEEMKARVEGGLSAAEAARAVLGTAPPVASPDGAGPLVEALARYDGVAADELLDRLLASFTVETVVRDVVLPALREVGDRWERGGLEVAQEHFASQYLRGRMLALARGWDRGIGPRALLACPPEELHDLGLLAFGLALRDHGFRITFLGADSPVASVAESVRELEPDLVVLAAVDPVRFAAQAAALADLARRAPLALAGAGASDELAENVGARHLDGEPTAAAAAVAAGLRGRGRARRRASRGA